ncbi:MFS transporter [Acetobacter fabarum]|uniref:MFS transporter n=1 Tax=Acetobacter fabarum TaxID=483199 RepID=UPI0039EBD1A4
MVGGLRNRAGLLVLAAISAADCAAHSMNSLGPFAVGELVRGGRFSIMQAGLWSCVEMLAYAVAMTAIAPLSARLRLRLVALLAGIGLVVAQAGSAFAVGVWPLLALRVLSGGCLGGLNAVVNIGASRLGKPVFVLAFVMVVQTVVFSLASLLLPHASALAGQKGIFLALAGLVVVLLPLLFFLPDTVLPTPGANPQAGYAAPAHAAPVWALLAVLFYTGGSLAVWPFTQRIGLSVGLAPSSFGVLSAVANIAGLVVCLATVLQSRRHITSPLLVPALVLAGGVCVVQACPPTPWLFCTAFVLNYAAWFFVYPSLVGLTCLVDPTGKLASRAGGAWMFSQAATTLFASATQTHGLYLWTGLFSLALCLCAALATLRVTRPHAGRPGPNMQQASQPAYSACGPNTGTGPD